MKALSAVLCLLVISQVSFAAEKAQLALMQVSGSVKLRATDGQQVELKSGKAAILLSSVSAIKHPVLYINGTQIFSVIIPGGKEIQFAVPKSHFRNGDLQVPEEMTAQSAKIASVRVAQDYKREVRIEEKHACEYYVQQIDSGMSCDTNNNCSPTSTDNSHYDPGTQRAQVAIETWREVRKARITTSTGTAYLETPTTELKSKQTVLKALTSCS